MTAKGFRLDIQGVRGIALVLVLLTHAEIPLVPGGFVGLDMFFVLSGFLITGLIVTEIERKGTCSLIGFYGRRAKRILPAAVTVLFAVVVGSLLLYSVVRRDEVADDVLAAALYVVNWHFAFQHVDYFAFNAADVSPVQHYWSLSVEEQFYLAWPLLLLFGAGLARRSTLRLRPAIGLVVVPFAILSLAYSIYFTGVDAQQAYFSSFARVWQLALGGVLALALPPGLRLRPSVSAALTVAGLATLLVSAFAFDGSTPYPGWRALLPTMATAVIIVAGTAVVASGPIRLLTRAPFQYLGKISYSWYLWHWPVVMFGKEVWGASSPAALVLFTGAAWIPATLTHYAIEEPFRRSRPLARRPRRALALGLACTALAAVGGVALRVSQPTIPTAPAAVAEGASSGANVIQRSADAVRPDPREVETDRGRLYDDGCKSETEAGSCVYGVTSAETTVALIGDSHAVQYFPTLERIARDREWRLVALARADCTVADVEYEPGCDDWRERALTRIEDERPSIVVVTNATSSNYQVLHDGERLDREASQPYLEAGFARVLRRLRETGANVSVIRDQPRAPEPPAECVAEKLQSLDDCAFEAERPEEMAYPARAAEMVGNGVHVIDPMPVLCPGRARCPAVIGNVVVYRDEYHLSATFAESLRPWLERELPEPASPAEDEAP